jgi:hypothetical protein
LTSTGWNREVQDLAKDGWTRIAIAIGLLVTVAASLWGLALDRWDFVSNLLAELAGLTLAFVIGLLVFDRLAERRRAGQWARVRILTIRGIAGRLAGAFTTAFIHLHTELDTMIAIQGGADKPSSEALAGYRDLASEMAARTDTVRGRPDKSTSDLVIDFYEAAQWDLDQIQLVLYPRVIESSADQQLIDALADFDEARRNLHDRIIGHKLSYTHAPLPACVKLFQSGERLYRALCGAWEGN